MTFHIQLSNLNFAMNNSEVWICHRRTWTWHRFKWSSWASHPTHFHFNTNFDRFPEGCFSSVWEIISPPYYHTWKRAELNCTPAASSTNCGAYICENVDILGAWELRHRVDGRVNIEKVIHFTTKIYFCGCKLKVESWEYGPEWVYYKTSSTSQWNFE